MDRSDVQESLLSLYLRLNGYFVTGFIVHSPEHGRNRTEIDTLAVRFPNNAEPERVVKQSAFFQVSRDCIDLIICEVKSKGKPLQFNPALRQSTNAIDSVLRWAGLFTETDLQQIVPAVRQAMLPQNQSQLNIPTVEGPNRTRIRCILCCPERNKRQTNQPWFLHGQEMIGYIHACLCPTHPRSSCSTSYDFGLWGVQFESIVKYFKKHCMEEPGDIWGLYEYLGV